MAQYSRTATVLILALVLVVLGAPPAHAADCSRTSVGLVPLIDLGTGAYFGFEGGLYRGGSNRPPAGYLQEGSRAAYTVRPLDATGAPDRDGRIVLLSIGLSNTQQEFAGFMRVVGADPQKSPYVTFVNGAQGGKDADQIANPNDDYWPTVAQRLAAAGVTPQQVQVVWLKEALAGVTDPFPRDAPRLQDDLRAIVHILSVRLPNLKLVYLASRTYAGYATINLSPEPVAYQTGFAVKWLVEERIARPGIRPWLAWGPYLWTDSTAGRSDGLTWECSDVRADGTHPSPSGVQKVAMLLLNFFKTDPTATPWFLWR